MITAGKPLKNASTYLSGHLCANDYYCKGEMVTGVWIGKGAEMLGLVGETIGPKDAAFEALRCNKDPRTGEKLTARDHEVVYQDFQISPPKSVSIQAIVAGDDRLFQAHEESWRIAFKEFERYACRRDREGDKANTEELRFTGNLVTAAFTHDASRALDAQIHTHLVCANATYDAEKGQWYALQNSALYKANEMCGRLYEHELAKRAIALGYELRQTFEKGKLKGWELAHISDAECELQSARRKQIEEKIAEHIAKTGIEPTTTMKHAMAVSTRDSNLLEISTPEVRSAQRAKFDPATLQRFAQATADAKVRAESMVIPDASACEKQTLEAIESAVRHHSHTEAVFDEKTLLARALRENPGQIDFECGREVIAGGLGGQLVRLHNPQYEVDPLAPTDCGKLTTLENLKLEKHSTEIIKNEIGKHEPLARDYKLNIDLSPDQRTAVEGLLNCRDGVMCLRGPAGTGKTTTLSELDRVVRAVASGSRLDTVYVAPMHAAKGVLQADGFADATTVAKLMVDLKAGRIDLRRKLLVVDEAGMLSTRDGHALLSAAIGAGARVLYAGDQKQLSAHEAGDFLSIMQKHSPMKTVELSEIHRQRDPGYKAAMELMAKSRVKDALEMLDNQGRVQESGPDYLKNAAEEYCRKTAARGPDGEPASVALVASTWREVDKLNELVREKFKASGEIVGPALTKSVVDTIALSPEELRTARNYEPGMVVSPASRKVAGMEQGRWYSVQSVSKGMILLENNRWVRIAESGDKLQVGRRKEIEIQTGDKILLQGNDRKSGLTNGTLGVVTGFDGAGVRFRSFVKGRASGEEQTIPHAYETMTHGFATTIHASQGQTVVDVIGATAKRLSGQLWNVMTSRGRRNVSIYLPQKDAVLGHVGNTIENRQAGLDHFRSEQKNTLVARTPAAPVEKANTKAKEKKDLGQLRNAQSVPTRSRSKSLASNIRQRSRSSAKVRRILQTLGTVASRLRTMLPASLQNRFVSNRHRVFEGSSRGLHDHRGCEFVR